LIRPKAIAFVVSQLCLLLGACMLLPGLWGWARGTDGVGHVLWSAVITVAVGGAARLSLSPPQRDLGPREGILLVVVAWLAMPLFGCLPFVLSPHYSTFTDAFFEAVSGFTTTGATVLSNVEVLSEPVQLWRHFTHWLGGMGIVVLVVAVLPLVGHGGMHMYKAEFSGARAEKLKPRITETAAALWRIYFAYSLALCVALLACGMNLFEALCHTFSTLGTGGFSTRTASVAAFESPSIEWVLILFMWLAGMSFIQHYHILVEGRPGLFVRDHEIRSYTVLLMAASALIAFTLSVGADYETHHAVRAAVFQVSSILSTTGFATEDFERWHPLAQLLLLALMFVGGCTGSTAGGLKVSRLTLLARVVDREFKRMVERRGVFTVRLGGEVIPETTIQSLLNLVYLAFVVNFASCLALAAVGVDVLTSISAVAASMFNVGPALGGVGPTENYGHLPAVAKWVLAGDMIAGRLEFYTVIVIFTPAFWRK
jgi:trk system potassium uptake protein TrkH